MTAIAQESTMRHIDPEPNARQAWTNAELDQLRALISAHVPVREIADRLGRTEYAVRSKASQMHISLKPPERTAMSSRPR
jgi:hypothetical protein